VNRSEIEKKVVSAGNADKSCKEEVSDGKAEDWNARLRAKREGEIRVWNREGEATRATVACHNRDGGNKIVLAKASIENEKSRDKQRPEVGRKIAAIEFGTVGEAAGAPVKNKGGVKSTKEDSARKRVGKRRAVILAKGDAAGAFVANKRAVILAKGDAEGAFVANKRAVIWAKEDSVRKRVGKRRAVILAKEEAAGSPVANKRAVRSRREEALIAPVGEKNGVK
jgi:hypothetical protein